MKGTIEEKAVSQTSLPASATTAKVLRIAVGSQSPPKVEAVKRAVARVFPGVSVDVVARSVPSGVSDQPQSDKETIQGALTRARSVIVAADADIGIGLEGGTQDTVHGMLLTGWVAAVNKDGSLGLSGSSHLLLPELIARGIRNGEELGPLMDSLTGRNLTKHQEGTAGILTQGHFSRVDVFEKMVVCALARFYNASAYVDSSVNSSAFSSSQKSSQE